MKKVWQSGFLCISFSFSLIGNADIQNVSSKQTLKDTNAQHVLEKFSQNNNYNLLGISQFQADHAQIANLSGFEQMKQLQDLSLVGNLISNLQPLKALTNLRSLNLAHNQVSEVFLLVQLPNLEYLNLSHNKIKRCFFCTFSKAKMINVSDNQIQQIFGQDKNSNKFLEHLNLSNNPISSFPQNFYAPNLKELNLSRTQLSNLESILNLSSISSLNVENCPNLHDFGKLFYKNLDGSWHCTLPKLTQLTISENFLSDSSRKNLNNVCQFGLSNQRICINGQWIEATKTYNSSNSNIQLPPKRTP